MTFQFSHSVPHKQTPLIPTVRLVPTVSAGSPGGTQLEMFGYINILTMLPRMFF